MILISEEEVSLTKWSDTIEIKCDYCGEKHHRTKRNVLKSKSGEHYCDNTCQAKGKREKAKTATLESGEKQCTLCKDTKPLDEFNKNKARADGYNTVCRICSNAKSRQYYDDNTEHHKKVVRARNAKITKENQQRIFDYYKDHPCVDCGETNPIVLEFDHRDETEKIKGISNMVGEGYSWARIEEEIAKCDVRCANCHRIRTAKQLNWYQGLIY